MKLLALAFAAFFLSACSQDNAPAVATPDSIASQYMESLLKHDASTLSALTEPASQAAKSWEQRSKMIADLQADAKAQPVAVRNQGCPDVSGHPVCSMVVTTATGDAWRLVLHLSGNGSSAKVSRALFAQ